jgi:hypothetical protein
MSAAMVLISSRMGMLIDDQDAEIKVIARTAWLSDRQARRPAQEPVIGCGMSLTVDIRPTPTYLHVTLSGNYVKAEIEAAVRRIVDAAHEHRLLHVLIDCLQLAGDLSLSERIEMGEFWRRLRWEALLAGKPSGYWMAVVGVAPLIHPDQPAMKVMISRGLNNTAAFARVEDALAWLRTASSAAPQ